MSPQFDAKKTPEKLVLKFDFSAGLDTGETLVSGWSVAVSVAAGQDVAPSGILNGASQLDAAQTSVLVPVQAGNAGASYLIGVICPTSNAGKVLALSGVLPVISL